MAPAKYILYFYATRKGIQTIYFQREGVDLEYSGPLGMIENTFLTVEKLFGCCYCHYLYGTPSLLFHYIKDN